MATDTASLLPPNATSLERAIEASTARAADVPVPIRDLWNPQTCPVELLPWLAWALSIDGWEPGWSEGQKRDAVADAIALQRVKGSAASIDMVLARYDDRVAVLEWFEPDPDRGGEPVAHSFEVRLDIDGSGGDRVSAAFAERLLAAIGRVKPVRSHPQLVQHIRCDAALGIVAAAQVMRFDRHDGQIAVDDSEPWLRFLQTEDGEPITEDDGTFLEDQL